MAVSAPVLISATKSGSTITLVWGAVTGATSYVVKYGTTTGVYTTETNVGLVTSYIITGLLSSQVFIVVQALQDSEFLLDMEFEGTNGQTTTVDSSPIGRTITTTGSVVLDTSDPIVGVSSAYFPADGGIASGGGTNFYSFPTSTDFAAAFWAADWKMEAKLRWEINNDGYTNFFDWDNGAKVVNFQYVQRASTGGPQVRQLSFSHNPNGNPFNQTTLLSTSPFFPTLGTEYKVAIEKIGTNFKFYVDDVQLGPTIVNATAIAGVENIAGKVGADVAGDPNRAFQGWMDAAKIYAIVDNESENSNEMNVTIGGIDGTGFKPYRRCGFVRQATISTLDLSHLEGEKVAIMANGQFLGFQTVLSGSIVLNDYYSNLIVGLPYVSDLETLPIELQTREGTLVGKKAKISNVTYRVIKSFGGKIGPNKNNLYEAFTETNLSIANSVNELDEPIGDSTVQKLYTTDIRAPLGAQYQGAGRTFYRQRLPYPIQIGAIVPEISVGDSTAK